MKTRRATAAVIVAAGCALAGCGASAPSAAMFDKQANAICVGYNKQLRAATASLSDNSTLAQAEQAFSSAAIVAQSGHDKLVALDTPSGQSTAIHKVLAAQQTQIDELREAAQAIKAGDKTAFDADIDAGDNANQSIDQQFDDLGLRSCGSGTS